MTIINSEKTPTDPRRQGRVLFIARAVWLVIAFTNLVSFIISVLRPFGGQTLICPFTFNCAPTDDTTLQALYQAQISLATFYTYATVFGLFYALIFLGLSVLLFWRVPRQWTAFLASFTFLLMASDSLMAGDPTTLPLVLRAFVGIIQPAGLVLCLGFFFVLFPDGRFVPRWSWLIGCTLFVQFLFFVIPPPLNILSWPLPLIVIELVLAYGSPIALQVYRYRRVSNPAQRQQTKWVIFGLLGFLLLAFIGFFAGDLAPTWGLYQLTLQFLPSLGFLLIPLSITIAIQRSGLWDIDVLINRALVYGSLTLILILLYAGLVFGAQALLVGLIGNNDSLVIVASTLIVAVLFQPLRRVIQNVIDRRFYRQKYDAQRTLQTFSATLHQQIDLAQLNEQIVTVVQETVQPAHVSLWLFQSDKHPLQDINK